MCETTVPWYKGLLAAPRGILTSKNCQTCIRIQMGSLITSTVHTISLCSLYFFYWHSIIICHIALKIDTYSFMKSDFLTNSIGLTIGENRSTGVHGNVKLVEPIPILV